VEARREGRAGGTEVQDPGARRVRDPAVEDLVGEEAAEAGEEDHRPRHLPLGREGSQAGLHGARLLGNDDRVAERLTGPQAEARRYIRRSNFPTLSGVQNGSMIEVANLSKRYGELAAVRDASFTAPAGQILGFLGPNGAGKTTTMRIITGFLPATSGTVRVEGFDVFAQSSEVRRRIGYLPESPPLYNDMTVAGYLRFVAKLKGMARGDIAAALDRVLE